MLIAEIYFISSFVFFALFLFFLYSYGKSQNKYIFYYALAFLLMYLFSFSLSVPVLTSEENAVLNSSAYVATVFFVFCLLFICFRIQLLVTNRFYLKNYKYFNYALFLIMIATLYYAVTDLRAPEIGQIAVVWNQNIYVKYIMASLSVVCGLFWTYLFRQAAILLTDQSLRKKLMTMSLNGLLYGVAGLSMFFNESVEGQIFALALFSSSVIMSAVVFMAPIIGGYFKK